MGWRSDLGPGRVLRGSHITGDKAFTGLTAPILCILYLRLYAPTLSLSSPGKHVNGDEFKNDPVSNDHFH